MVTKHDFYLDQAMLARIRRAKDRREAGDEGEEDEDDDEEAEAEEEDQEVDGEQGEGSEDGDEPEPELQPRSARTRRSIKRERMDEEV